MPLDDTLRETHFEQMFVTFCSSRRVWKVIDWLTPFPIMKEIEQDQNMALAVLIGLLFVSISIIIAAVIVS